MATALIYDSSFLEHKTGRHPENPQRLKVILSALQADVPLWTELKHLSPQSASDEDIARCHGNELIDQLRTLCERSVPFVDLDTVISRESYDVARLAAGAAITAVDHVFADKVFTEDASSGGASPNNRGGRNAFVLARPPGHHATPNRAMGFCLFNNAAIAARYAQARYGAERVLIIDWDVHHGNGTQDIFYSDPSVFYFSTHQYPYYPGTGAATETGEGKGEGATLNIPLSGGTSARAHHQAFKEALEAIERKFPPDLVIISAGFDSRRGDPLGGLMLEDTDFREMSKEVMGLAERHASARVVSVLEGGYNLDTLGETVRNHVEALSS